MDAGRTTPARPQDDVALVTEEAAERVAARLRETFSQHTSEELDRLRRRLAALVVELEAVSSGKDPAAAAKRLEDRSVGALLDALGHELLNASPDGGGTADATLGSLRAWWRLRAAIDPQRDVSARADEDLRSRMSGADAFPLLVEVAHDFRSPLTSILFLSETLRDAQSGPVTDIQRSQLGLVYSAAFGLAAVASDIVDLAREQKGLLDDDPEPYAFAELFRDLQRLVGPLVEEKGLELRIIAPERGQAVGHPYALTRVLLNLTTNALKFTERGSVEVGVRRLPHNRLEYYVQDTGRGIPEVRQKDLFQPFKRRLGTRQEGHFFSGSGVGLSIARRLVEAMGSELCFRTSDEAGTRFFFEIQLPGSR